MAIYLGSTEMDNPTIIGGVSEIRLGSQLVWQPGLPIGTTFNFDYTGTVQSVELPRGKYKLQCWGAQGGTSYTNSNTVGSKGGYSEGVLTLTEKTTLYIFVGGKGSRGNSTTLVNGGWNGGGASVGYTYYNSGGTMGECYPACGGGATDISTVTSSMNYSNGRTNRSAASLLARCIVAGGGAGGSHRYTETTTTTTTTKTSTTSISAKAENPSGSRYYGVASTITGTVGHTYKLTTSNGVNCYFEVYINGKYSTETTSYTVSSSGTTLKPLLWSTTVNTIVNGTITESWPESSTSTSTSQGASSGTQQGGGTSGKGQYPGTQSSAGSGSQSGGFGYGANQPTTGNRYDSGAGGGGWYGGGSYTSDSSTGAVNYSGGGSGFVNTSANASYRPSGYTGLQLDSGTTINGATSFESVSGGTETGHSGNGYARITVIE